tara:strand:+ start:161 stop:496 length:336 start_codon:yes stop_codon:yes gene_type:complete
MANKVKINKALKQLTEFFIKEGKILDENSYTALKSQPVLGATLNYIFGGYRGAIASLKASPQFGPLVKHLDIPEVKPTVKPVETKAPVWSMPANKPAATKPAKVKVEKKDG